MNNKSGVTLVTMVIIVIVIVILSTISIIGGTEIIDEAKDSKNEDNLAALKAKVNEINLKTGTAGVFTPGNSKLYGKIASGVLSGDPDDLQGWYILDKEDLEEMGIEYVDESYLVNYRENKVITMKEYLSAGLPNGFYIPENSIVNYAKEGKIKVGDYVKYTPISGEYVADLASTGVSNNQTFTTIEDVSWRVFSIDETTDEILIVSQEILNERIGFYGVQGFKNCKTILNDVCEALYSDNINGITARCLSIEDLNKASGYVPTSTPKRYAYYPLGTTFSEGDTQITYNGNEYIKVAHYSNAYKFYEYDYCEQTRVDATTGYTYAYPTSTNPVFVTETKCRYNITNEIKDLFDTGYCWLASTCVETMSNRANFLMYKFAASLVYTENGLTSSGSQDVRYSLGFRPVVILKSIHQIDISDTTRDGSTKDRAWKLVQ